MDRRIGFAENVNGTNTFYYYLTDQVGTVLRIVREDGTVVNQYDYDAFGRVRQASPNTFTGVENRYLFQGREWDKNGGFYYFRNRIYLPERGEFATPDMNLGRGILGELDGMATLTFCGGDPVNCIDPDGLRPKLTTWLRSGGTYWDVNDMPDNVRASLYATDYDKDGVISTRAGTHALIGILGVFEGAALMGWDIGEGLSGSENIGEENMIAGMINLGMDEGVGTLAKEAVLSPFKAIASGDAEQFGTGMFGLYMIGRQMQTGTKGISLKNGTKSVAPASKPVVKSTSISARDGGVSTFRMGGAESGLRHANWAGNLKSVNATVHRLGTRALRESKGNWRKSEALFETYLKGVQNRLIRTGSKLRVEIQPAAIPGIGRVPAFRKFRNRMVPTRGSRRLDAGIVDPDNNLVSGFDITLNPRKPSIVEYYQEAFGDIIIDDIRLP